MTTLGVVYFVFMIIVLVLMFLWDPKAFIAGILLMLAFYLYSYMV